MPIFSVLGLRYFYKNYADSSVSVRNSIGRSPSFTFKLLAAEGPLQV